MVRILLVRHGETPWNQEGRQQGRRDIALSELGRSQARALGSRLADQPLTRAVASPLARARETAEIALGDRKTLLALDPGWMEIDHGAWEGLLQEEIEARFPEDQLAWRLTPQVARPTGGEGFSEVLTRAQDSLRRACSGLGEEDTLLVVTHDGVTRALVAWVLGLPFARIWSFRQAPTAINLLEGPDPEHLTLVRLNDASHINPLFGEANHRRL